MQSPIWVIGAHENCLKPMVFGNQMGVFGVEEGQKRPGHALPRHTRHVHPLIRPTTAKPASSQGGALALDRRVHTSPKTELQDMIMEFYS
jgi:hypothetical protein